MKDDKRLKALFIEQLSKTPIIQVICEKAGISRPTFYRWKEKDQKFAEAADRALEEGRGLINDFAESQLINAIKDGNMGAVTYWLNHNHQNYSNKLEINGRFKTEASLTPEQEENIRRALEMGGVFGNNNLLIANLGNQEEAPTSPEPSPTL